MQLQTNKELQLALDFVQYTNQNIFLTGKAGTGKTTFLHTIKESLPKRMAVVAPTGVAAINARGVTIHSFFQMSFGPQLSKELLQGQESNVNTMPTPGVKRFNKEKIKILKSLDLLVIDEISMVRADILDGIDEVLRRFKNREKPFGGVQLLMIGDMQQLAPVIKDDEWNILRNFYDTVFFFSSIALQKSNFISIELKHIYRQSDQKFISLLNKIRDNQADPETLKIINKRYIPDFKSKNHEGYIILTTHNAHAQNTNQSKLDKLQSKSHFLGATVEGDFPEYAFPTEHKLELKEGAQVMFVKNDISRDKLFYNGKIGKISSIEDDIIWVECPDDETPIPVSKMEWQNVKFAINNETKELEEEVIGKFIQYPLKLAWAITIHKSQGLTFERAIIDAQAAFAHGQVYVALSRCKSYDGLVLSSPISNSAIHNDNNISRFSQQVENNPPCETDLDASKRNYELMLLEELFHFSSIQYRIYQCIKITKENAFALLGDLTQVFTQMNTLVATEIASVSEKFKPQIHYLLHHNGFVENNTSLQERIKKGCNYFYKKLETIILNVTKNITIETDNKTIRKQTREAFLRLEEETAIKLTCLESCKNGFSTKEYLNVRAKATLENFEKTKEKTKKTSPEKIPEITSTENNILFEMLKAWRKEKADDSGQPLYMILHQKVIFAICELLPSSMKQLNSINGLGKKKVEQFGEELLELVEQYCKNNNIPFEKNTLPLAKKKKKEKIDTKQISFEMYMDSKSVLEIAQERNLTIPTIEGHLAHFVGLGKLDINKFVPQEIQDEISSYFNSTVNKSINLAKSKLGNKVSYSDLKFVLAKMRLENS